MGIKISQQNFMLISDLKENFRKKHRKKENCQKMFYPGLIISGALFSENIFSNPK
jgi:hypothetical protein